MEPSIRGLHQRLDDLLLEVKGLRARLERLEAREHSVSAPSAPLAGTDASPAIAAAATDRAPRPASGHLPFVGRTLMLFGGAYLLRAFTDGHVLSSAAGATLGLLYAAVLLALASRDARRGDAHSANHLGFVAIAIAFPLIAETTTRLHILPPVAAAALIVVFVVGGVLVAWGRSLVPLAWFTNLFALVTIVVALRLTGAIVPFLLALFLVAVAVEVLAFDDRFLGARWPVAIVLDLVLVTLAALATRADGMPEPYQQVPGGTVVAAELALPALYLASVGSRTIILGRFVRSFAFFQGPLSLVVGLTGAARGLEAAGFSAAWVGVIALVLAAASYGVAFAWAALHEQRAVNFYFYSALGGLLLLAGAGWIFNSPSRGIAWAALALTLTVIGILRHRWTLVLHGAILAAASAWSTGLTAFIADAVAAAATAEWRPASVASMIGALAMLACYGLVVATREPDVRRGPQQIPYVMLGAVAVGAACGLAVRVVAAVVASAPGPTADAGSLAAARTGVIAIGAVALAAIGRGRRTVELRWFVWPLLVACGLKIVVEDFANGRPLTQFFTLAFFGAALILTPRLMRRSSERP